MYFLYKFELTNGYNLYTQGIDTYSYQDVLRSLKRSRPDLVLKGVEIYDTVETLEEARMITSKMKEEDAKCYYKYYKISKISKHL